MGKLIVIEGLDGSGKSTQLELLPQNLKKSGIDSRSVSFPDYDSNSSALVKMYLGGEFGKKPGDVNAYAASLFYAVDRFASYQKDWKLDYEAGSVILADRYVTSNMIYQLSKVGAEEKDAFIRWVEDYEYGRLGLPEPTATIYLDMKPEISQELMKQRYEGDESKKDIHERDVAFLKECRENALYSAEKAGWNVVCCYENDTPKTIEQIHEEVMAVVNRYLTK